MLSSTRRSGPATLKATLCFDGSKCKFVDEIAQFYRKVSVENKFSSKIKKRKRNDDYIKYGNFFPD